MSPPSPPGDLPTRSLPVATIQSGTTVFRFYRLAVEPIHYDRGSGGRLNAPDASYGVLYCAKDPRGGFAETFLREPGRTQLPATLIARYGMARLTASQTLRLAMLHGPGLARMGATAEVTHGGLPYAPAQAWSGAIHGHGDRVDGVAYTARHDDNQLCYAIFDRARGGIVEASRDIDLDQNWFYEIAEEYGAGLRLG